MQRELFASTETSWISEYTGYLWRAEAADIGSAIMLRKKLLLGFSLESKSHAGLHFAILFHSDLQTYIAVLKKHVEAQINLRGSQGRLGCW